MLILATNKNIFLKKYKNDHFFIEIVIIFFDTLIMESKKILIGGQALRSLGSSRHTDDVDYLVSYDKRRAYRRCNNLDFKPSK